MTDFDIASAINKRLERMDSEEFKKYGDKTIPKSPLTTNPKLNIASKKRGFANVPPSAYIYLAQAMDNGSDKYGQMNWRKSNVISSIYINAAMRHLLSWADGEELAEDSKVHHLAHAMACCAIVLDAKRLGVLEDDRSEPGDFAQFLEEEYDALQDG